MARPPIDPTDGQCYPHWFEAAWRGMEENSDQVIFCKKCGEIRALVPQAIPAPVMEQIGRDYGEPT